tara:strand:+ start:686 stop:1333 length:648 start_codon:yes stop_codon:yes gene_type:complete
MNQQFQAEPVEVVVIKDESWKNDYITQKGRFRLSGLTQTSNEDNPDSCADMCTKDGECIGFGFDALTKTCTKLTTKSEYTENTQGDTLYLKHGMDLKNLPLENKIKTIESDKTELDANIEENEKLPEPIVIQKPLLNIRKKMAEVKFSSYSHAPAIGDLSIPNRQHVQVVNTDILKHPVLSMVNHECEPHDLYPSNYFYQRPRGSFNPQSASQII